MTDRRSRFLPALLTMAVLVALASCKPAQDLPIPFVAPPGGAALSVPVSTVTRGSAFEVAVTGCDADFQDVEVRLVVGLGDEPRSATATWAGGGAADPVVPLWAPSGPARVEASCLEPNMSHASDGADIKLFDYQPVQVTVSGGPGPTPSSITVPDVVTDGVLRVSGSDCSGSVLLSVSRGRSRIAASDRFHYGRTLVQPAPNGTWSAEVPLRYSVSEFTDPAAPGAMTVFAACDGRWFPGENFMVADSRPSAHLVGPGPSTLYLSQCPPENVVGILGLVTLPGGATEIIARNEPGHGYGEMFHQVPVPDDATSVTYWSSCNGDFNPRFQYVTVSWSA